MKMISRVEIALCFAVLFSGMAVAQQAVAPPPKPVETAPANAEVLKLLLAGMPETVVLDKIHAIAGKFDTSADALVELKQAGATEAELKAVLAQSAGAAEQPPAVATAAPGNAQVLKMLQTGVQERVILHVISALNGKFDTSADALAALKQAGASEAELNAMGAAGAAPANAPTSGEPSLAETVRFIVEKLNGLGNLTYVAFFQNSSNESSWTQTFTNQITNVVADPSLCNITYHRKATNSGLAFGKTYVNTNKAFSLREVQKVVVWPYVDSYNEWSAQNGSPNITASGSNPPITELSARLPHNEEAFFYFTDADLADRVAKALNHAVELCGGGNKTSEPF